METRNVKYRVKFKCKVYFQSIRIVEFIVMLSAVYYARNMSVGKDREEHDLSVHYLKLEYWIHFHFHTLLSLDIGMRTA